MSVLIAVFDAELRKQLEVLSKGAEFQFVARQDVATADVVLASEVEIRNVLGELNSEKRPTLFVTVDEKSLELPTIYLDGQVDDILVLPIRRNEFLSRVRWHYHLQHLRELEHSSAALPGLIKKLEEDLNLAEKIQRRLIRDKFPPMQGVAVKSKYWCGMRSGGDYFDVIEMPGGQYVAFLLSDSSSYSLSSSLLGSLMHQSLRAPSEAAPSPEAMLKQVLAEVTMKEKDRLSIFFGILDRKTYRLRYVSEGAIWACRKSQSGVVDWLLKGEREALTDARRGVAEAMEVRLDPEDRLLLMSDGWRESMGGAMADFVEQDLQNISDPQRFVNEFSYRLQKSLSVGDEESDDLMPPQDCSVLLVDIEKNILRLA